MIQCPNCKEKGISESEMSAAKGEVIICTHCSARFVYKKPNILRYLLLCAFGLLLPLIVLLSIVMLSFSYNVNEFFICVVAIVPVLILICGRDAIKLDKNNLLRVEDVESSG